MLGAMRLRCSRRATVENFEKSEFAGVVGGTRNTRFQSLPPCAHTFRNTDSECNTVENSPILLYPNMCAIWLRSESSANK